MANEFKVKRGLIIDNVQGSSSSEEYLTINSGVVESRALPSGLISGSSQISDLGFVDTTGTPLNNQLAVFTDSNTIEGDSNLVWDGSKLAINGLISASSITANSVTASVFSGSYFDFDPLPDGSEPVWKEGRVFYSAENGSLSVYNSESDITLQVGQEFYIKAKNGTVSTILNGTPVRISGSNGQNPVIYPAVAEDHSGGNVSFDNHIIGIATHDISGNGIGFVTEKGLINEINTSAFSAGDILYLQTGSPATPEAHYRNTPPPFPYDIVQAGYVVKSHSSEGIIAVEPKEPIHFGNISGLSGSLIPDVGDLWIYQANNAWTHTKTLSGSYAISDGSLTANSFTGSLFGTSSYALNAHTSSYVEWTDVNNIPSGLISGSSQITNLPTSSISNFDTAVSASAAAAGFGSGGGGSSTLITNYSSSRLLTSNNDPSSSTAHTNLTYDGTELKIYGETSSLFRVEGSSGTIFSIEDSTDDILMSVNDISGLPLFEIDDVGLIRQTTSKISGLTTTTTLFSFSATEFFSAHLDYNIKSSANDAFRAGSVIFNWYSGSNLVSQFDTHTDDIGNSTAGAYLSASVASNTVVISAKVTTGTWDVRVGGRVL